MLDKIRNQNGVSLIELLAALAISSVLSLAVVQLFSVQNKLYAGEQNVSLNISNARIVVDTLARHIRMIGFNPQETANDVFGLKDSSGNFTTNPITSNASLYFTKDNNEDGILSADSNEKVALSYDAANNTLQLGSVDSTGVVASWMNKWYDVTAFSIAYVYYDGTSSSGTTDLPDNTVTNHTFDLVTAIVVTITTRTEKKHHLTGAYVSESVESTILLRNANLASAG